MFADERKEKIIEILKIQNRVTVQELTEGLSVSEATIRRDLQELEQLGALKRAHGGAILNLPNNNEPSFNEKEVTLLEEKRQIAKIAANFIKDGETIILDSGTTTVQMIPFIAQKKITVITNSVATANIVSSYENIDLLVLGGRHRSITKSIVGNFANEMCRFLHADKAFIATNAFEFSFGFSTPNMEEAEIKRSMIASADEVYMVSDYSKFNKVSMVKFAALKEINNIITDTKTPNNIITRLKKEGVNVIIGDS